MSYTIEDSKFVIFGNGHDGTSIDSGEGETTPPEPPTPPLEGYLFKYGQIRPMEQFDTLVPTGNALVDTSHITYTGGLCYFTVSPLSKSGTLPSYDELKSFVESVTDVNGATFLNPAIGQLIPISRTDTASDVLGIVPCYLSHNTFYKLAYWCKYDRSLEHWTVLTSRDDGCTISYAYNDVDDDNIMSYTLISDENDHFRLAKYHPSNPEQKSWSGVRLNLSSYDFYYWS